MQWVARVASDGDDIGWAIAADSSGNVYVTGQGGSGVAVSAFNANGTLFGSAVNGTTNSVETFTVKYDTNGNCQWISSMSGAGADRGRGISLDSSNNIYIAGEFVTSALIPFSA